METMEATEPPDDRSRFEATPPAPPPPPPAPSFVPWVTIVIAAANVIAFAVSIAAGASAVAPSPQTIFAQGGNFGPATLGGEPWRLLTSMFLHYGILHIAMNMIGLLDGGRHVERMYGRAGFAALYLVAGIAGSLASAVKGGAVSAGASGAIFGIFGAFGAFLLLHRDRLDTAQLGKQTRGLLAFLAYNVIFGLQAKGIDMTAHIGGLAGGFVAGLALELGRGAGRQSVLRAALVGVIGTGLVLAATQVVPKPEVLDARTKAALDRFVALEAQALARYNSLVTDSVADDEAARVIEEEVIPTWLQVKAAVDDLERRGHWPSDRMALLRRYLQARGDGFDLILAGLRASDQDGIQRGMAKMQEAEAHLAGFNKP